MAGMAARNSISMLRNAREIQYAGESNFRVAATTGCANQGKTPASAAACALSATPSRTPLDQLPPYPCVQGWRWRAMAMCSSSRSRTCQVGRSCRAPSACS